MKQILLFLFFLSFFSADGQNMSLAELISLSNKSNWVEVDGVLSAKGWVYHESKKGDENSYDGISWSYKKETYSDKASAWFYAYEDDGNLASVSYQVFNKPSFLVIQRGVASSGLKVTNSEIGDDEVKTVYESKTHRILVKYSKRARDNYEYSETSLTAYTVNVSRQPPTVDDINGMQNYTDDDGNNIQVLFKSGKPHGILKKFNPDGVLILSSTFVNGSKTGISKEYDQDGDITLEANYIDGEIQGDFMRYYYGDDGVVATWAGKMVQGKKSGLWITKKYHKDKEYLPSYEHYESDILNGSFKESTNDSIIYGTYLNNELHGEYKIYQSIITAITGVITGDSARSVKITEGYYNGGLKTGNWKTYSLTGSLISEGRYHSDQREGDWKFYHDKYSDEDVETALYSGKLFKITHYDNGRRNGKSIQYTYMERSPIKCDLAKYPDKTPLDTCYTSKIIYEPTTSFYKDDLLHGPIEIRDSADVLVTTGVYVNDIRSGMFMEAATMKDDNGHPYYLFEEGLYKDGNREGLWKSFKHRAFISQTYFYKQGKLDGSNFHLNASGKPYLEVVYSNDKYQEVIVYDSIGVNKIRKYKKLSESESAIILEYVQYLEDAVSSQVYFLSKLNNKVIYPVWLDGYFLAQINDAIDDSPTAYPDGQFTLYDRNETVLVRGEFKRNEKVGQWSTYFPGTGVHSEKQFINGSAGPEYFYLDNSTTLYSGELKQYYPSGKLKSEFDISKGLRDGKSKYFTAAGKNEKTEKYKNGILQ